MGLGSALALGLAQPSQSFNQFAELCGNKTAAQIAFSGSQWSQTHLPSGTTLQDQARLGRNAWIYEHDYTGQRGLDYQSGPTYTMGWTTDARVNGALAVTQCDTVLPTGLSSQAIWFNEGFLTQFKNGQQDMRGLSAHEWGHVWGLGHSGDGDSFDGHEPVMATCTADGFGDQRYMRWDDSAAFSYLTDVQGSKHAATANHSFENGKEYWTQNATSFTSEPGGYFGSDRARITSSGTSSYISSRTRVYDMEQVQSNGNIFNDAFDVQFYGRASTTVDSGHIRLTGSWRGLNYAYANNLGCNFYGDDMNSYSLASWQLVHTKNCTPTTSWLTCTLPQYTSTTAAYDAWDLRLYIYNRVRQPSGSYQPVYLDRARVRTIFS